LRRTGHEHNRTRALKSANSSDLEIFDAADLKRAVEIYKCPEPHYEQGIWAAQNGATAIMDISDGFIKDSSRLARSSGVSIELYGVAQSTDLRVPLSYLCYTGDEDHALLVTFPPRTSLNQEWKVVGRVVAAGPQAVIGANLNMSGNWEIWDHFRC
jgi:thiamine-monophosphate kinase